MHDVSAHVKRSFQQGNLIGDDCFTWYSNVLHTCCSHQARIVVKASGVRFFVVTQA